MKRWSLPSTSLVSLLAALTTWLTMTTWSGFSEDPSTFLRPLFVGCAIVAVSGALLRAARLHPILVLLAQVAVVALWLNHRIAAEASILGWLPTPQSIRDAVDAFAASLDAAQSYTAPVPASVLEFWPLLVVLGSFLAVLVDFLACGLRRVPLAGLPLLAMYTAPVSLLDDGVAWWKFALVAVSFLALLAAEEATRLSHWGRDLGADVEGRVGRWAGRWAETGSNSVWPSARKIGATATGLAIVIPVFVPTFTGGVLAGSAGDGPGEGGDITISSPMADLKRDLDRGADLPMVVVTTDDPRPEYLRTAVLDEFDGSAWKPSDRDIPVSQRADGDLPSPVGLDTGVDTSEHDYEIAADDDFDSQWLPAPYPAIRVNAPGDWRYDLSTMDIISAAKGKSTEGVDYDVTALRVDPTPDQLRQAGGIPSELFRRYTEIDRAVPDWVDELAHEVTEAGTNRAERAALLQDWFAQPHADEENDPSFTYDLARSDGGSSVDDLTDFLQGSRTGYCEQFAAAMALMAREIDIPARVAVGFLRPSATDRDDTWVYSSHDLHAWPELYFEGVGWVLFEPTPNGRAGASSPPYTAGLQPSALPTQAPTATNPTTSASPSATASRELPPEPVPTGELDQAGPRWPLYVLVALPLLLVVAVTPRVARSVVRRRRWASADSAVLQAEAAWDELRDSMLDLRLPWHDRVTIRQRADQISPLFCRHPGVGEEDLARVIRNNPAAEAALSRIAMLLERARYARTTPEIEDVKGDVALCVEALRIGVERSVKRKADWLPASLLKSRRRTATTGSGLATLSEPSISG
jgi:transglutaminase-like putative cysteine protease